MALSGCVAKTVYNVATLPVKVVGKGVDLVTTSQSEADEKRGRELRKRDERLGALERDYDRLDRKCADGSANACRKRDEVAREISELLPPAPPRRRD